MANNIDKKALGLRIRAIRQEKGMTLEEFGKLFGAGKGLVSRWENGLSVPSPERIKLIAKVGDKTVDELLYGDFLLFLMGKINSRLPKDKQYLESSILLKDIVNAYSEIQALNISLSDEKTLNTILDKIIIEADKNYDETLALWVNTIKKHWDKASEVFDNLSRTWELWSDTFSKKDDFKNVIYSNDKVVYSKNKNFIESYFDTLDYFLNDKIFFLEGTLYTVKLKDFDIAKNITEYKKSDIPLSVLISSNSVHNEKNSTLGIYSPKQQAVFVSDWYTNGYKDFLYSRKHCVIYNQKLYATELLEDDTFLIDNQKVSIGDVYYFAPLVAILY